MKLKPEHLKKHLEQKLLPIYIISGNEPLLVQEYALMIHEAAQAKGYEDKQVFQSESGFDWQHFYESANSLSLFSQLQRIDLRIPNGKPGDKGGKILLQYASQPNPDTLLLVTLPKVDGSTQKTKWFKALEQSGAHIQVWPLESHQFAPWLKQRAAQSQLTLTPTALELLSNQVDGNLLAAAQEIEKLKLLAPEGPIDEQVIENSVGNNARYDAFQLCDSALQGNAKRCMTILNNLKGEGSEPTLILWALSKDIRALHELVFAQQKGEAPNTVYKKQGIWPKRQGFFQKAMSQHSVQSCQALIHQAHNIDKSIKGVSQQDIWLELTNLVLGLSGVHTLGFQNTL